MRLAVISVLALAACAGTFHPDLDDSEDVSGTDATDPSGTASMSSTSVGTTDNTSSVGTSDSPTTPGSESDDDASSEGSESSDEEGTSSEDLPEGCGDEVRSGDEECDGEDLADQTCESRGMLGGGTLGCFSDCTFDVSACSLGGAQPEDGLWSACVSYEECPAGPEWECEDNFCSVDCATVADCGPSPGGNAVTECRLLAPDNPEQGARCYLNCENGKSCPTGMVCWGDNYCRSSG